MNLLERVKAVMTSPEPAWAEIDGEADGIVELFANYAAYLVAIPAVAGFIGMSLIGFGVPGAGTMRVPLVTGLLAALFQYVAMFGVVYVLAVILYYLAPMFGGQKDLRGALKLVVYSHTPVWIAGIFLLIPGLRFLVLLGLYGLYLLFKGLPIVLRVPASSAMTVAATIVAAAIVLGLVVGAVRASIFALPGLM
jgi:hypothetical protein